MKKILTIMRRECLNLIGKPAYWISLILVPFLVGILVLVVLATGAGAAASAAATRASEASAQGVIDNAGILRNNAPALAAYPNLKLMDSEAAASEALAQKSINSYFVIEADYIASGRVRYIAEQFSPLDEEERTTTISDALRLALFGNDSTRAERYGKPVDTVKSTKLAPVDPRRDLPFSPVPIIAGVTFMGALLGSATYLMQSVATERESRIMEVLLSTVTPLQLLVGKILGLGLVGFIQLAIWMSSTLGALPTLRAVPQLAPFVSAVTPAVMLWSIVYFVIGYFIFASLMAGVGAIVPNIKDGSSYSFLVTLPLLIPMYLNSAFTENPDGALAVGLSLFPLSAPVAMPMRMLSTDVPLWQAALVVPLMLLSAVLVIGMIVRLFSAQSLLRGSKLPFKDVLAVLLNRPRTA
jgi:ABC-2 type transport system permease protein